MQIIDGLNCEIQSNEIKYLKNVISSAKVELKSFETDQIQSIWYSKLVSTSDAGLNLMQRLFDIQNKYTSILPSAQELKNAGVDKFVGTISSNIALMIKALLPMFEEPSLRNVWANLRLYNSHKLETFRIKFFICQYERLQGLIKPDTMDIIEKYFGKIENDLPSSKLIATKVLQRLKNFKSSINLIFDDFCGKSRELSTVMKTVWRILLNQIDDSRKFSKLSQKTNKLTPRATKMVNFMNENKNYINQGWKTNSRALLSIRDDTSFTIDAFISMLQFCFSQLVKKCGKSSSAEEAGALIGLDSIQNNIKALLIAANNNQVAETRTELNKMNELFYEKYHAFMEAEGEYEMVLKMLNSFKLSPLQRHNSFK